MKKINICLSALVLLISLTSFAQQKKPLKGFLAESRSIHKKNASDAQSKTTAAYFAGRSVNYFWDNSANLWQYMDTSLYIYNTFGLLGEEISRNGYLYSRKLNTYDLKQRLILSLDQNWDSFSNQWKDNSKITYVFDSHDNQIEFAYYSYNSSSSQWDLIGGNKDIITYNSSNKMIDDISQNWNSSSQAWQDTYRTTNYIYNSNGDATQYESMSKNNSVWDKESRFKDVYSIANVLVEEEVETWNGTAYVKSDRYTNITWHTWSNSVEGSAIGSYTTQAWGSPISNQWNTIGRTHITYDAYGGSVSLDEEYMNSNWVNDYRYSEFYNTHSHNTGYRDESWNTGTNNWVINYEQKTTHTYDASNNITQTIWQDWDSNTSTVVNNQRKDYSDYKLISGIRTESNFSNSEISVYPNPFSSHFILRLEDQSLLNNQDLSISVYDLFGKEVSQTKLTAQETQIERGNLAPGVYFYSVMDKTSTLAKGKLVVE